MSDTFSSTKEIRSLATCVTLILIPYLMLMYLWNASGINSVNHAVAILKSRVGARVSTLDMLFGHVALHNTKLFIGVPC